MTFSARTMKKLYTSLRNIMVTFSCSWATSSLQTPENTLHDVTDLANRWAIFWSVALRMKYFQS